MREKLEKALKIEPVKKKPVKLKLTCSAADCDAVAPALFRRSKITLFEIDMQDGTWRYGTTTWGQPPTNKKITTGPVAHAFLTTVKEMEPMGYLTSYKRVEM